MNKQDRKALAETIEAFKSQLSVLTILAEAEREKFDNMPEGLQTGERGERIEQAADALDEAVNEIEMAVDGLEEWTED